MPFEGTAPTLLKEVRRHESRAAWSWEGLRHAWRHEKSFRQWVVLNLLSVATLLLLFAPAIPSAFVVLTGLLILSAELMNSAIEAAVDHTSLEISPIAKSAKDLASASVFVTAVMFAVSWAFLLLDLVNG